MAKLDTRKKILEAAEELFSINGYNGVPTKKIASYAGVTEMTLFNHFKNKELLYKTVVKERFLELDVKSAITNLTYDDLESDLKKIAMKMIDIFMKNRNILMMRLKEKQSFLDDSNFNLDNDPMFLTIIPVFNIYEEKSMISGNGKENALIFIAAFKGICYVSVMEDKSIEYVTRLINNLIHVFCNGIISNN